MTALKGNNQVHLEAVPFPGTAPACKSRGFTIAVDSVHGSWVAFQLDHHDDRSGLKLSIQSDSDAIVVEVKDRVPAARLGEGPDDRAA